MPTGTLKGLNSYRKVGSAPDNGGVSTYSIASGYATSIGLGDPVKLTTDGTIVIATNDTADAIGVFKGVKYTKANGEYEFAKSWPASTVATDIQALVEDDPARTFQVQGNGPIPLVVNGDIFAMTSLGSPNTYTGRSTAVADVLAVTTGNVALPASGATALVGSVSGMADADTFTIKTSDAASATTITILTATTRDQFMDALNAVDGISATLTGSRYLSLASTNGYDIVLATGVGAPLTDLGLAAGTYSQVVASSAGMVKVVKVIDTDTYAMEVVLVNHDLRDDG